MCVQTVGLVQAELERAGIATVSISLLESVTSLLRVPRALVVDRPFGYPLGFAGNAPIQHAILAEALALLERDDVPVLERFGGA